MLISAMSSTCISNTRGWRHGCHPDRLDRCASCTAHARAETAAQREPRLPRAGDDQSPHARGARHPAGTGTRDAKGTGAGAARIGKHAKGHSASRIAAHGAQAVGDRGSPGAAPRARPPTRPVVDLDKVWTRPLLGNRVTRSIIRRTRTLWARRPQNQVRFRTEREAQEAGYRRAANDPTARGRGVARTATGTRASGRGVPRLMRLMDPEDGEGTATSTCGCMPRNATATGA